MFHRVIRSTWWLAIACVVIGAVPARPAWALSSREFDRPPYLNGAAPDSGRAAHLTVRFERDPGRLGLDARMLEALDSLAVVASAHLDSLGRTRPISLADMNGAPDVYGGCVRGGMNPESDALADECDPKGSRRFVLAVSGPSRAWRERATAALRDTGASAAIVVTLEFSQQWVKQKNLRGDKGLDLGTGHSVALPWLTGLDTPAEVLGFAGAVVDGNGKVLRVGFEGLIAKRTGLTAGSVGAEEMLRAQDVERLRDTERRTDLPGEPLVWRAALESLVAQLLARPAR